MYKSAFHFTHFDSPGFNLDTQKSGVYIARIIGLTADIWILKKAFKLNCGRIFVSLKLAGY